MKTIDRLIAEFQHSKTMKAFGLTQRPVVGNVPNEMLELTISVPEITETEVLVKIMASTLHIDDIALAQGTALGRFLGPKDISSENPYVMGSSFSGLIVDKGDRVTEFEIGDEVIGIPNKIGEHGSWAAYRCLDKKNIRLKPKELSHQEVAATILAGCVAYGMILYSNVRKGDNCLVLGASGGIGSVVVQMLKAKGAVVTSLCSTRNIDAVRSNGADFVIDYQQEQFSEKLAAQGKRMDFVFDSVGGKELENESIKVLNKKGKFLTVCGPAQYIGSKKLGWGKVIAIFWHIIYRSFSSKIKGPVYQFSEKHPSETIDEMLNFVIQHNIKIPFDRVIPLKFEELRDALKHLAAHKATGRIVIDMNKEDSG